MSTAPGKPLGDADIAATARLGTRGTRAPIKRALADVCLALVLAASSGCSFVVSGGACDADADCPANNACVEGHCLTVESESREGGRGPLLEGVGATDGEAGGAPDEGVPDHRGDDIADAERAGQGGDAGDGDVDSGSTPDGSIGGDAGEGDVGGGDDNVGDTEDPGVDEGGAPPGCETLDADGDGWNACQDCDEGRAEVHPGADERCNGVDDDCDGVADNPCAATRAGWPVALPAVGGEAGIAVGRLGGTVAVVVATDRGLHALDSAGDPLPGFPVVAGERFVTVPSLADIAADEGDGELEIIVAADQGEVHAITGAGVSVAGWPLALGRTARRTLAVDVLRPNHGRPSAMACDNDRTVHLISADGLMRRGRWPYVAAGKLRGIALADLDGDGAVETTASTENEGIVAVAETGAILAGFPALGEAGKLRSPVVDVGPAAEPGGAAIWVADEDRRLHRVDRFGRAYDGWPVALAAKPGAMALADLDGDGRAEGVVGDSEGNLHIFNHTGDSRPGWPISLGAGIIGEPVVADLGPRIGQAIIAATSDRQLHAVNAAGAPLIGFPVATDGNVRGGATVADLDANGRADIVVVTDRGVVSAWELGADSYQPDTSDWPTPRGDNGRTGRWGP